MRNLILTLMIWMLAFTAITAAVVLTYEWYSTHGYEIRINFDDASGLVPGQSKVIYRGVMLGTVNSIRLNRENGNPVVKARISKNVLKMLGKDSKFWIVRPELGFTGVRNLSAISTGNYVAVEPVEGPAATEFTGSFDEPIDPMHTNGLQVILRTSSANGIGMGTPILYRGMTIGEIGSLNIAKDKRTILLTAYIEKRFAEVVRKSSYFGNVSGFHTSFSLFSTSSIDLDSFRALMTGSISLFTPNMGAPAAKNGDTFTMLTSAQMRRDDD
jgi:paraquat-inducible protein B